MTKQKLKVPTLIKKLHRIAVKARENAHAPYSNFKVGCALVSGGKIFTGCNVENQSLPCGICSEHAAVAKAVSEGYQKFDLLLVVSKMKNGKGASPCGKCLQVLSEFMDPDTPIWIANPTRVERKSSLRAFLPQQFERRAF